MVALIVWIALILLAGGICVAVIFLIRKPMSELLKVNSYLHPARNFYLRSFTLVISLATLGVVVSTGKPCSKQSENFIQCLWWLADNLDSVFISALLTLGGYALLMTVLFAALGRYHDE